MSKALRWLTLSRLLVIVTFVAVFVMAMRTPLDTDTLWHLRAGEWQVQHRALLRIDIFSHTRQGQAWINHSWLSQIILYAMYILLGDPGLALYTAVLATAGMFFVYLQLEGDILVRSFVLILASAAAAVFWTPRPQMISFFLSAVVLYLLWLYQKRGIDKLWWIPPLFILWGNLHGGFAIGFILLLLAMVGAGARWLFDGILSEEEEAHSRTSFEPVTRLAVIGLISAAAVSLNPYGPSMLLYPFRTVGIGVLRDYIQEWASPNFHRPEVWPFIWMLLGTLILVGVSGRRLDWRDAIFVGGTGYSALLAGRNIATFAIVTAPVISEHASAWLATIGYKMNWNRPPRTAGFGMLNGLLVIAVVTGGAIKIAYALNPQIAEDARRAGLPVEAVRFLETNHPQGPIFNSYNWGGYLIWTARDYPVYVDGRTDLYDDDLLTIYLKTYAANTGWEQNLDNARINIVLVETQSPLARVLEIDSDWRKAYEDNVAILFVRKDSLSPPEGVTTVVHTLRKTH